MATETEFTLGAAQAAPVYFDREASTDKACELIREAGKMNVDLLAFGETWLPGYPFFHATSHLPEGRVRYLENAVEIPSPTTERLCAAAHEAETDVVIGVAEAVLGSILPSRGLCSDCIGVTDSQQLGAVATGDPRQMKLGDPAGADHTPANPAHVSPYGSTRNRSI